MSKTYRIGRSNENDIVVGGATVSRNHALLTLEENRQEARLRDLNSGNGTYVNDKRLGHEEVWVGMEDEIRFGEVVVPLSELKNKARQHDAEEAKQQNSRPGGRMSGKKIAAIVVGAILATVVIVFGIMHFFNSSYKMNTQRIYNEYRTAVCWVYCEFGYKIYQNGEDITDEFTLNYLEEEPTGVVNIIGWGELTSETVAAEGTAFFISDDGKLGTNLHVAKPWIDEDESEDILEAVQELMPRKRGLSVKATAVRTCILLDGEELDEDNLIDVRIYNEGKDVDKDDVAILQTCNRKVPKGVKAIIDISKADDSEDALAIGKTVFTIGYPLGSGLNQNNRNELKSQCFDGKITQDRGKYEFGTNVSVAHGSSGSPVLNEQGRLVGVIHSMVEKEQGLNQAIKVSHLIRLLDK